MLGFRIEIQEGDEDVKDMGYNYLWEIYEGKYLRVRNGMSRTRALAFAEADKEYAKLIGENQK